MPIQWDFKSGTPSKVTVGATTTEALADNTARKFAVLTNDSNEDIYLSLGSPAVMNSGIRLNARGGVIVIDGDEPFRGVINAICASGSKNLSIFQA